MIRINYLIPYLHPVKNNFSIKKKQSAQHFKLSNIFLILE